MSLKFDDVPIIELNLKCKLDHDHPALSSTVDYTTTIPGMHGAYDFGADMGPKPFNLPMEIVGVRSNNEIALIIRKIKKMLLDGYGRPKYFKLSFDYEPDKYYNVRYSGNLPIERLVHKGKFTLPLTSFDAVAHSVVANNEVTWGSTVLTFASTSYTFGHKGSKTHNITGTKTIVETVTGDTLRPIFNIKGSGINVKVSANGQSFSLGTFSNTTWLIDGENYTVLKNGVNGLSDYNKNYPEGDWIELLYGDNDITISGIGLNLTFEVRFRDKYM
ncbi:hypothetical protein CHH83_20920 [Bacillus sp. 7586-K]|nr:hypothetical protein CHH83_20920 [Bacillus sp. 7586-K]